MFSGMFRAAPRITPLPLCNCHPVGLLQEYFDRQHLLDYNIQLFQDSMPRDSLSIAARTLEQGKLPVSPRALLNAENPRAHKNRIGTSVPPPRKLTEIPPPKTRYFMGMEVFIRSKKSHLPVKLAQPFLALDLRAENLRTLGFLWSILGRCSQGGLGTLHTHTHKPLNGLPRTRSCSQNVLRRPVPRFLSSGRTEFDRNALPSGQLRVLWTHKPLNGFLRTCLVFRRFLEGPARGCLKTGCTETPPKRRGPLKRW